MAVNDLKFDAQGSLMINSQYIATNVVQVPSESPKALTGGAAIASKNCATILRAFHGQLPKSDRWGQMLTDPSIVLTFDSVKAFLEKPGLAYKVCFGVNARSTVNQVKAQQSSAFLKFEDPKVKGESVEALLLRGETRMTQEDYDRCFMFRDLQKCSIMATNAIVGQLWTQNKVMALMPQARARYSDAAIVKASKVIFNGDASNADIIATIMSINISTERKPSQMADLQHYDCDVALAQILYGMVTRSATPQTIKIGRDTVKKIIKDSPRFNVERTRKILTVLIENSGGNSADVDQLVEMAKRIVDEIKVPKDIRLSGTIEKRDVITPTLTKEEVAELLKKNQSEKYESMLIEKMERFTTGRSEDPLTAYEHSYMTNRGLLTEAYEKKLAESQSANPEELS